MAFRTKIEISDRQVKQDTLTSATLSGTTEFGTPFSALTSGVDLDTVVTIGTLANVYSTFSGNTGTTVFDFYDSRMVVGVETLTVITDTNSGDTQTALGFEGSESVIIDGNTVNTEYTGATYDFTVTEMVDDGFSGWTGTGLSTWVTFLSGDTLDYQDRAIWVKVKGITETERLILVDEPDVITGTTRVLARDVEGDVVQIDVNDLGADKTFLWNQGTPASTWYVAHSLSKYPSVVVIDSVNKTVEGHIEYVDDNNVILSFNGAFSGDAIFN